MLVLKLIGYWKPLPRPSPRRPRPPRIDVPDEDWPDVRELVDPGWRPGVRARIVRYLRAGHYFRGFLGSSYCRFDCGINRSPEGTGSCELTDGEWAWPEGLAHYVQRHAVRLPDEFVETMEAREWLVPGHGAVPTELADLIDSRGSGQLPQPDITVDPTFWQSWSARIPANPTGAPGLVPGRFGCLRIILRRDADLDDGERYRDAADEIDDRLWEADCGTYEPLGFYVDQGRRIEESIEGIADEQWAEALDIVAEALSRHGLTDRVAILRVEPDLLEPHRDREPVQCACGKPSAHEDGPPDTASP
jgi:hypothetical protein